MSSKKDFQNILLTIEAGVARIVFNRPDKKNAMSPDLHDEMHEALDEIEKQDGIKVIVITGAGDSAFCGGMDLEKFFFEPLMESPEKFKKLADIAGRWFNRLIEAPQIVVCSVNGYCFGGGVDLVGISDLAVAAEEAVMGLSEVNFGVLPAGGTTWAVKNNFNRKQGLRYCLTGETFTGKEAVDLGLVNIAVPREKLAEETERLVQLLVTKNALTLEAIKKVFTKLPSNWYEAVEFENGKAQELAFFQGEKNWLRHGLKKFKDREYKPGLESVKLDKGE
jgi:trans-feruloyl-CoA hydratase/vanillin synthase